MATNLTTEECNKVLAKIKSKYSKLITEYKKSPILMENFQQRYIAALRSGQNLTPFFMGEIEAVEELLNREQKKFDENHSMIAEQEKVKKQKETEEANRKTNAQAIMDENLKKIRKYPAIDFGADAIEDISRLLGAVRMLINDYYPALIAIFRDYHHLLASERINNYYDILMTTFDYKGEIPIARRYNDLLKMHLVNSQKLDYEYRYIMQETAFILNDIYDSLEQVIKAKEVPNPNGKLQIINSKFFIVSENYKNLFNGKRYSECFAMVTNFVEEILIDFRLRGIKRHQGR